MLAYARRILGGSLIDHCFQFCTREPKTFVKLGSVSLVVRPTQFCRRAPAVSRLQAFDNQPSVDYGSIMVSKRKNSNKNLAKAAIDTKPSEPITPLPAGKKPKRKPKTKTAADTTVQGVAAPSSLVPQGVIVDDGEEHVEEEEEVIVVDTKKRRRRATKLVVKPTTSQEQLERTPPEAAGTLEQAARKKGDELVEIVEEEVEEERVVQKKTTTRRRREPDPLPCVDPTPGMLEELQKSGFTPKPRPVPNLGYACLCMELRELKPPVFTSRDCIKKTLDARGLPFLGELCLSNCKDLARVIQWNHEHEIRVFRMSSVLWPWMGTFRAKDLPNYDEVTSALRFAGDLARLYDIRVTFHPSHFVKLAALDDDLVNKSIAELEAHSEILDLMGYEPSPVNKINIHVGGVYALLGDKKATMQRWADNWRRLSPSCRARMTIENDDVASAFSLEDLLYLHELCDRKLPLVFDFHHHRFCPGSLTEEQALRAAIATWPEGVRPVVHWSESQVGRKPHAHSDYVEGPLRLYGLDSDIDVMIESKAKERALIAFRDRLPIPKPVGVGDADEDENGATNEDVEMAMKML